MSQQQLTFDALLDGPRLNTLAGAVASLLADGQWRSLGEIRAGVGRGSEAGISARLRELRGKYGYAVEKRRVGRSGLWQYRIGKEAA